MIRFKMLAVLFLLILSNSVFATNQIPDILIYNTNILYLETTVNDSPLEELYSFQEKKRPNFALCKDCTLESTGN